MSSNIDDNDTSNDWGTDGEFVYDKDTANDSSDGSIEDEHSYDDNYDDVDTDDIYDTDDASEVTAVAKNRGGRPKGSKNKKRKRVNGVDRGKNDVAKESVMAYVQLDNGMIDTSKEAIEHRAKKAATLLPSTPSGERQTVTREYLNKVLKVRARAVTDDAIAFVNEACLDERFAPDEFLGHIVTHQDAMIDTSSSIIEYVNALRFCAFYETNGGNAKDAYVRARWKDKFVLSKVNAPYDSIEYNYLVQVAARYKRTPLVQKILTQAQMPLYLLFQGYRYKAVEVLAEMMVKARHDKDKINAADKLLTHVKPPENFQVELSVGRQETSAIAQLQEQLADLAILQKKHLEAGSIDLNYTGSMKVNVGSGKDEAIEDAEISSH